MSQLMLIPDGTYVSHKCLIQAMDTEKSKHTIKYQNQNQTLSFITAMSSRQKVAISKYSERDDSHDDSDESNESDESSDHSSLSNNIQVIFSIPYVVEDGSIVNQTLFITDAHNDQIVPSLSYICVNGSSFIVNYMTNKELPHNVCLYLLLNLTSMSTLREIFTCHTIISNISSNDDHDTNGKHAVGPSFIFIISQSVIILLMMVFISLVHNARNNRLANRLGQHLLRNIPIPQTIRNSILREPDRTDIIRHRSPSIGQQVLSAVDLTTTQTDRTPNDHTLIDITELTKRLSA
ncbi:hypothetical protein I4U23_014538 [Adineta vaga]|nr:hypothetical protein I4U23_014538 [Adineta vaga]